MKPGDVVMLKSGGAHMTIRYFCDFNAAIATGREFGWHCDWHDRHGIAQSAAFNEDQLVKVADA